MLSRRSFFAAGAAALAAATFELDPERALWVRGAKTISVPAPAARRLPRIWRPLSRVQDFLDTAGSRAFLNDPTESWEAIEFEFLNYPTEVWEAIEFESLCVSDHFRLDEGAPSVCLGRIGNSAVISRLESGPYDMRRLDFNFFRVEMLGDDGRVKGSYSLVRANGGRS